jgi:hypothetical protein
MGHCLVPVEQAGPREQQRAFADRADPLSILRDLAEIAQIGRVARCSLAHKRPGIPAGDPKDIERRRGLKGSMRVETDVVYRRDGFPVLGNDQRLKRMGSADPGEHFKRAGNVEQVDAFVYGNPELHAILR